MRSGHATLVVSRIFPAAFQPLVYDFHIPRPELGSGIYPTLWPHKLEGQHLTKIGDWGRLLLGLGMI